MLIIIVIFFQVCNFSWGSFALLKSKWSCQFLWNGCLLPFLPSLLSTLLSPFNISVSLLFPTTSYSWHFLHMPLLTQSCFWLLSSASSLRFSSLCFECPVGMVEHGKLDVSREKPEATVTMSLATKRSPAHQNPMPNLPGLQRFFCFANRTGATGATAPASVPTEACFRKRSRSVGPPLWVWQASVRLEACGRLPRREACPHPTPSPLLLQGWSSQNDNALRLTICHMLNPKTLSARSIAERFFCLPRPKAKWKESGVQPKPRVFSPPA